MPHSLLGEQGIRQAWSPNYRFIFWGRELLGERAFVGRLSLGIALRSPPIYNEASVIA